MVTEEYENRITPVLGVGGKGDYKPLEAKGKDDEDEDEDMFFAASDSDVDFRLHLLERLTLQASNRIKCKGSFVQIYPIQTTEQHIQSQFRSMSFRKCQLVEIFAVVLYENLELYRLETDVAVRANKKMYVLWDNINGQVNSEGDLILTGPDRSIEVGKSFSISPCYWRDDDYVGSKMMWLSMSSDRNVDCFHSNYVTARSGDIMEVRFAVYSDGVVIRLEATLSDLHWEPLQDILDPLQVYGSVKASNNVITNSRAKSVLFDHTTDHVILGPPDNRGDIVLPLSRSVISVPRNSSLVVDVCLYARCGFGGICIANSSVIFSASTGGNGDAEEAIIRGSNGKIKLRAFCVENEENNVKNVEKNGEEKNEEHKGEVDKAQGVEVEDGREEPGGSAISKGSYQMETDGLYEDSPDEKSPFRSPKVPRLNWHEDVSSRASEHSPTESSDPEVQEVRASLDRSSPRRYEQSLMELFSVKFVNFEKLDASQIYGFMLLRTDNPMYYVFRRVRGDPLPIDSKGFVCLESPNSQQMTVRSDIVVDPFLFKYEGFEFKGHLRKLLWNENSDRDNSLDKVISKIVESQFGPLEITYMVYRDGVEAHLKVVLTECCFSSVKVHGEITATNSAISDCGVSSMLFYREKDQAIEVHVRPGEETVLPLYKSMIVLPYDSILTLNLTIESHDEWIINRPFNFVSLTRGENFMSLPGNGCTVQVVVDFANDVSYY